MARHKTFSSGTSDLDNRPSNWLTSSWRPASSVSLPSRCPLKHCVHAPVVWRWRHRLYAHSGSPFIKLGVQRPWLTHILLWRSRTSKNFRLLWTILSIWGSFRVIRQEMQNLSFPEKIWEPVSCTTKLFFRTVVIRDVMWSSTKEMITV